MVPFGVAIAGLDLSRLPSVLAIPIAEYQAERDPLLRLWHLCDSVELTLRTMVALSVGDWLRVSGNQLPEVLRADLSSRIEQPTLGKWRGMALALTKRVPHGTLLEPLYPYVRTQLDPVLSGGEAGATIETSLIELRNRLAHGGGMSRGVAERLLGIHADGIDQVFGQLDWLYDVALWAGPGQMVGPTTGVRRAQTPERMAQAAAAAMVARRPEAVAAVVGDNALTLWPFIQYGVPTATSSQSSVATRPVPLMYARRGEVRLLLTPLGSEEVALAEAREAALPELQALVHREVKVKVTWEVTGFESEWRRDANHVVGRRDELAALRDAIDAERTGALWVTGPAGIGKSFLSAKLITDLLAIDDSDRLILPFRFKVGDPRCSRDRFLRFAVERLTRWLGAPKAKPNRSQHKQLSSLLADLAPDQKVVVVLDGLDEIAAVDRAFAEEVPLALSDRAMWVCAGRPEKVLTDVMTPDACTHVFPEGLPGLTPADARAMLLDKIGPLSKRLLEHDVDEGEGVVNPFVDRVVENAAGLPIYVAYVIGDVLSGRLRALDGDERLPPSLGAYHAELLRRAPVGSMHQILTPLVVTLAVAREALTADVLHAILVRRTLVTDDAAGRELVGQALAAASSMIRRVPGEHDDGFALFHLSLREHICTTPTATIAVATARDAIANAVMQFAEGREDAATDYLYHQGIAHLIAADRAGDGARLLSTFDYLMARVDHAGDGRLTDLLADLVAVERALADESSGEFDAWSRFVHSRAHLLERGGSIALLQAAIAEADTSPITVAAEAYVSAGKASGAWVRRVDRPASVIVNPCVRTLEGHAAGVRDVIVHPDGRRAISAGADATLRVWDLETGECLRLLAEESSTMSFTMIASVPGPAFLHALHGHGWTVWAVDLFPDGRRAIAAHGDGALKIWDIETGACLASIQGHEGYVWSVRVSPAGDIAASAGDDSSVRVWDLETRTCIASLDDHMGWVGTVEFLPDGDHLVSAGEDKMIRLWSISERRCVQAMGGHRDYVWDVAVSADERVVSASGDGSLMLWDVRAGRSIRRWDAHPGGAWSVRWIDERRIASAGRDGLVRVWDSTTGEELRALSGHAERSWRAAPAGGPRILSASGDRTLKLWDSSVATASVGRAAHTGAVHASAIDPTGARVITGGDDGTVKLWELATQRSLRTFVAHDGPVAGVAFLPEGDRALTAGADGSLSRWDTGTGRRVAPSIAVGAKVNAMVVSRDGTTAAVACADGTVRLIDLGTGAVAHTIEAHEGAVWDLETDAAWTVAVTAGADATIRVWDLTSRALSRTFKGHSWDVQAVALSMANNRVVSASRDKSVKVWDLATGACLHTQARHSGRGDALSLSADGTRVLSARDKTLHIWDVESAVSIASWPAESAITTIAVAPDETIALGEASGRTSALIIVNSGDDEAPREG